MKKLGVCTILSISALCVLLLLSTTKAYADTVTLESLTYGTWSGTGDYAANLYPYGFQVNGREPNIPLMCLSFEADVETNESWTATVVPISSFTGNTLSQYEEAAYILSLAAAPGASVQTITVSQWADWELFDPGDPNLTNTIATLSSTDQTDIADLLASAPLWVSDNPDSPIYTQFVVYLPVPDSGDQPADGPAQNLMGPAAPTPEPSSLVLLGSGLLGLAAFFYRRRRSVARNLSVGA
jgi:hypothetical protein